MLNLSVILEDSARAAPDRVAVVSGRVRMSYAEVNAAANQVANLLRTRGIGRADKVALCCLNLPEFPVIYFGILKAGAVAVPFSTELTAGDFAYLLDDCDARALFCYAGAHDGGVLGESGYTGFQQADACEHLFLIDGEQSVAGSPGVEAYRPAVAGRPTTFETVATEPTDTAVILYGSGTSGRLPLGAELTHQNMVLNAMLIELMFARRGRDVSLVAIPLFHSFSLTTCLNVGFVHQATLVMLPRPAPASVLRAMRDEKVTILIAVPSLFWSLVTGKEAADFDPAPIREHLSLAVSGGAGLPRAVRAAFQDRYGVEIVEGYGLTEASPVVALNLAGPGSGDSSVGVPLWGVEMKLIDADWREVDGDGPGEIAVRGHNVMKGYYGRPEATARVLRDNWLRTGDMAVRDAEGRYFVIDRAMDVIDCGGTRLYPHVIEEALMTHPQVSLAAVVGVPDESLGWRPKAFVVPVADSTCTVAELMTWARENLPEHARPHAIEFRESLPLTVTGKILKRDLA